MSLLNELTVKENQFLVELEELHNSEYPLLVWGGLATAEHFCEYLDKKGISIAAVVVNEKYWKDNWIVAGRKVERFERWMSKEEKVNIIVAFAGYKDGMIDDYRTKINHLYCYDVLGMFMWGKLNVMSPSFIIENIDKLEKVYNLLEDERSRKSYVDYLNQKITGVYEKNIYDSNQYFTEKIVLLRENEVFFDCGAFDGDSIENFIKEMNKRKLHYEKIYACELDRENCKKARENLKDYSNISIIQKGIWDKTGTLSFGGNDDQSSRIDGTGTELVEVDSIDHILNGRKVSFIKMDIEGSEIAGLKGAEGSIRKYKPILTICAYHKLEDIYEIPLLIKSYVPQYKLYFRNHSASATESVIYAIKE